jgi:hypothetical protein
MSPAESNFVGGWFADNILGFLVSLFRIAARKWRARRYKSWREVTATIVGVSWQRQSYFPHPDAQIVYTYRVDGGFYGGEDTKPFCLGSSAETYASQFARGEDLIIRVKPGQPEVSSVLDEDVIKMSESTRNEHL